MSIERFHGAVAWALLSPEQQAEIGAIALELVAAWALQERVFEDGRLLGPLFSTLGDMADAALIVQLQDAFVEAIGRELLEAEDGKPLVPALIGPICRVCGCTERNACRASRVLPTCDSQNRSREHPRSGGCGWAEPDLCTACAAPTRGQLGNQPLRAVQS